MCALLCFCPSLNKGDGLQINILTEVLVALGALLLLGSIMDLLLFLKIVIKTVANMRCLGYFKTFSKTK